MRRDRRDMEWRGVRSAGSTGPREGERIEDRFYVETLPEAGMLELAGREAVHAAGSRRLRPGDILTLFDGSGWDVTAAIVEAGPKRLVLEERSRVYVGPPLDVPVVCVTALPKGSHDDDLVALCAQLGVTRLVALESARSVVHAAQNWEKRRDRFRRLAVEAAKQSETSTVMDFADPLDFEDLLASPDCLFAGLMPADTPPAALPVLKLIGVPRASAGAIDSLRAAWPVGGIAYLIGPEGDFTPEEQSAALAAGFSPVCVSPTTLRVETAAVAFAAVISAFLCARPSSGAA